jgi:hypothetical protein
VGISKEMPEQGYTSGKRVIFQLQRVRGKKKPVIKITGAITLT